MSSDTSHHQSSQTEDVATVAELLRTSLCGASDVFDLFTRLRPAAHTIKTTNALLQACETLQTEQGTKGTAKEAKALLDDLTEYLAENDNMLDPSDFFDAVQGIVDDARTVGRFHEAAICTPTARTMVRILRTKENRNTLEQSLSRLQGLCLDMGSDSVCKASQADWFNALASHLDDSKSLEEQSATLNMFLDSEGYLPLCW